MKVKVRASWALVVLAAMMLLSACSGNDYTQAIPAGSKAVAAIDLQRLAGRDLTAEQTAQLLHTDEAADCGLDLRARVYAFVSGDDNLGFVAKVANEKKVVQWAERLNGEGLCGKVQEKKGCHFVVVGGAWVVGFSGKALVAMGPMLPFAHASAQQRIAKLLEQDADHSMRGTAMFDKLTEMDAPLSLVATATALPEQLASVFTFGLPPADGQQRLGLKAALSKPKGIDYSRVMIAASVSLESNVLEMNASCFSDNKATTEAINEARSFLRPITDRYLNHMSTADLIGFFVNVNGGRFVEALQADKRMGMLLAGMNAAIDMDNILRAVDGDMALVVDNKTVEGPLNGQQSNIGFTSAALSATGQWSDAGSQLRLMAQLSNKAWLDDVAYWKVSCPYGSSITDWQTDAYRYTDGRMDLYFGVSTDMQLYAGTSVERAQACLGSVDSPLPSTVQQRIIGKRLCLLMNINTSDYDSKVQTAMSLLTSVLGDITTILLIQD